MRSLISRTVAIRAAMAIAVVLSGALATAAPAAAGRRDVAVKVVNLVPRHQVTAIVWPRNTSVRLPPYVPEWIAPDDHGLSFNLDGCAAGGYRPSQQSVDDLRPLHVSQVRADVHVFNYGIGYPTVQIGATEHRFDVGHVETYHWDHNRYEIRRLPDDSDGHDYAKVFVLKLLQCQ